MLDLPTGREDPEALPLGLHTHPRSVEGSHENPSLGGTSARPNHLEVFLMVQYKDGASPGLPVLTIGQVFLIIQGTWARMESFPWQFTEIDACAMT